MWCAPPAQSSQWDRRVGDEASGEGRAEPVPTGLEGQLRQLDSNLEALGLRQISRQGNSVGRCMFPEEPSYGQQSLGRSEGCQAGARQSEGGHGVPGEPGERRWSRRMGTQAKGPHSSWWPRTSCGAGWMVVGTQEQSGMGVGCAGSQHVSLRASSHHLHRFSFSVCDAARVQVPAQPLNLCLAFFSCETGRQLSS